MKNFLFLAVLSLVFLYGCSKEEAAVSSLETPIGNKTIKRIETPKPNMDKLNGLIAGNQARLAQLGSEVSFRSSTINVPADYPTIQEAVDAASAGTNIFVNGGTYNETVFVSTAGLNIKAVGNVLLNGGFFLGEGANNVKIQKFNIDVTSTGSTIGGGIIIFGGVSGIQIIQNTITGDESLGAYAGIDALAVSNMTIRDNNISCAVALGIHVISWNEFENGTCRNNTISQNTVSGTTSIGLSIEGDTDYTLINGNTVNNNPGFYGIWICGCEEEAPFVGFCDNNVVKNNTASNNDGSYWEDFWDDFGYDAGSGFDVWEGGENNTIGPNNTFNNNRFAGINFYFNENSFHLFNNTALENDECDVVFDNSIGQDLTHNNTYECETSF